MGCSPQAINSTGQVVGFAPVAGGQHAFLYTEGRMIDLNTTLPADSGWSLREATGINDRGQIVGAAARHGMGRSFLLTP